MLVADYMMKFDENMRVNGSFSALYNNYIVGFNSDFVVVLSTPQI